jgi:hypothetical protein
MNLALGRLALQPSVECKRKNENRSVFPALGMLSPFRLKLQAYLSVVSAKERNLIVISGSACRCYHRRP